MLRNQGGMKMKIRKGICLTAAMALCLTACGMGESGIKEEGTAMTNWQEQALALSGVNMEEFSPELATPGEQRLMEQTAFVRQYLAEKYPGTDFVLTACVPRGLAQSGDRFVLHAADDPTHEFTVDAEDGSATDNYYGLLKVSEYESHLEALFQENGVQADVYSSIVAMLPGEFNAQMPIETAAVTGDFFSYTWILLPPGSYESDSPKIQSLIEARGMGGEFTVYELCDPLPEDITKAEVDALIPSHSASDPVYANRTSFVVFCR